MASRKSAHKEGRWIERDAKKMVAKSPQIGGRKMNKNAGERNFMLLHKIEKKVITKGYLKRPFLNRQNSEEVYFDVKMWKTERKSFSKFFQTRKNLVATLMKNRGLKVHILRERKDGFCRDVKTISDVFIYIKITHKKKTYILLRGTLTTPRNLIWTIRHGVVLLECTPWHKSL